MRKLLLACAAAASFAATPALAQERLLDGALGGASGGILFGPVGLVAGAVVGATAGPAIATAWGLKGKPRRHVRHRRAKRVRR